MFLPAQAWLVLPSTVRSEREAQEIETAVRRDMRAWELLAAPGW